MAEYVDVEYWEETEEVLPQTPEPDVGLEIEVAGSSPVNADGWINGGLGEVDVDCWQKSCWTFQSINSTPDRASS